MKKAIILVAGVSKRLRRVTNDKPKCLLMLNGITILDYQIKALTKINVDQILIVVGYKKDMIIEHVKELSQVTIVENNLFETTDNAYSTFLALREVNPDIDSVIILDGDILFDFDLLRRLVDSKYRNVMIIDEKKTIQMEDCKVRVKDGFALAVGKKINGQAVYTSMIKMGGQLLKDFIVEVGKERSRPEWYSESLNRLIKRYDSMGIREMRAILSGNLLRCEIDTWEDLLEAKKIYRKIMRKNQL